jgi:hypothetical protein
MRKKIYLTAAMESALSYPVSPTNFLLSKPCGNHHGAKATLSNFMTSKR